MKHKNNKSHKISRYISNYDKPGKDNKMKSKNLDENVKKVDINLNLYLTFLIITYAYILRGTAKRLYWPCCLTVYFITA